MACSPQVRLAIQTQGDAVSIEQEVKDWYDKESFNGRNYSLCFAGLMFVLNIIILIYFFFNHSGMKYVFISQKT